MKTILVCAEGSSFWTYNYIKMLSKLDYSITLWSEDYIDNETINKYKSHNCSIILSPQFNNRFPLKLAFLLKQISMYKICNKFDIINIHYITIGKLKALKLFGFFVKKKVILSYWGSDLLRNQPNNLKKYRNLINNCLDFTFDNGDLKSEFKKIYKIDKGEVMMFPLPILEEIKNNKTLANKEVVIEGKIIRRDKISVCIGYSGNKSHQHQLIIDQLSKLLTCEKEKILLYIPLTYGNSDLGYIKFLKEILNKSKIEYVLFENKLSDVEVAKLRINTDVFINGQTTDAFSGSVCECLYAGSIIVNAKWLHYKEFDQYPLSYIEFSEFKELPDIIKNIINNKIKLDVNKNEKIIWELRSTEMLKNKWKVFLDSNIEKRKIKER